MGSCTTISLTTGSRGQDKFTRRYAYATIRKHLPLTRSCDPFTGTLQATACKHEIRDLDMLIDQLSEIVVDWKILAQDLKVPRSIIDRIQMNEQDIELRRRAVSEWWYDSQERPCWEPVVKLLRGMSKNNLAGRIEGCLFEGCDCHLVKCTVTRPTGKEADYSEPTPNGYSITGTRKFYVGKGEKEVCSKKSVFRWDSN